MPLNWGFFFLPSLSIVAVGEEFSGKFVCVSRQGNSQHDIGLTIQGRINASCGRLALLLRFLLCRIWIAQTRTLDPCGFYFAFWDTSSELFQSQLSLPDHICPKPYEMVGMARTYHQTCGYHMSFHFYVDVVIINVEQQSLAFPVLVNSYMITSFRC